MRRVVLDTAVALAIVVVWSAAMIALALVACAEVGAAFACLVAIATVFLPVLVAGWLHR